MACATHQFRGSAGNGWETEEVGCPLGAGGARVVTFDAHLNPLSARRRWTRSTNVIRRTISSLVTLTRRASIVDVKSGRPHECGEGHEVADESRLETG
jgi:hypothetical protein